MPAVTGHQPHSDRGAFTLVELMVSVTILLVAMLAVSYIFSAVSKTTGLTTANIELTDTLNVLRRTMQEDLNAMVPGFLLIASPPPEMRRNLPGDPDVWQARHDRIFFVVSGSPGQYQSFWNPTVTSSDAAIFYGQGLTDALTPPVYLFDRILCRRTVLLVPPSVALTGTPALDSQWGHGQGNMTYLPPDTLGDVAWDNANVFMNLNQSFQDAKVDAIEGRTASDLILRLREIVQINPSTAPSRIQGIPDRNFAPAGLPPNPSDRGRACFNLMPRVGDVIIEWSDGSLAGPIAGSTIPRRQWFGLGRDVYANNLIETVDEDPNSTDVLSRTTWASYFGLQALPAQTEWWIDDTDPPVPGGSSDGGGNYLAMWTERTWGYRPKAIRVTVRLYDANKRVRDADQRLGLEASFVLEVP